MKGEDAIKLMDDEVVTRTVRDEEYYKESKAHRKKYKMKFQRRKCV
jgi:hypothetical protein